MSLKTKMTQEPKLRAYIIERTTPDENGWKLVNLTELTEDGVWHCGLNVVNTSIEDAVEKSARAKVPIMTRETMEKLCQPLD